MSDWPKVGSTVVRGGVYDDLVAECARLKALLRQCIPSLQKDGRPHVVTMVQAALGDITTSQPPVEP